MTNYKFTSYLTEHRYHCNKTIGSLQRDWSLKYRIKLEDQLLFFLTQCGRMAKNNKKDWKIITNMSQT